MLSAEERLKMDAIIERRVFRFLYETGLNKRFSITFGRTHNDDLCATVIKNKDAQETIIGWVRHGPYHENDVYHAETVIVELNLNKPHEISVTKGYNTENFCAGIFKLIQAHLVQNTSLYADWSIYFLDLNEICDEVPF